MNKSFLKWAGGKYSTVGNILKHIPKGKRYIEPFVGSGVMFLNVDFDKYIINDLNKDLINLYKELKKGGNDFIEQTKVLFTEEYNNQEAYNTIRKVFNETTEINEKSRFFIYLNRHCFNGLYRINSSGSFNVPFGKYSKPYFPEKELLLFQNKLKKATILNEDYLKVMDRAEEGDVIYCDPPYVPLSSTSNFTGYTEKGFSLKDHESLRNKARELTDKGVKVFISNHDTEFTQKLYKGNIIDTFEVRRSISSKVESRTTVKELLVCYN